MRAIPQRHRFHFFPDQAAELTAPAIEYDCSVSRKRIYIVVNCVRIAYVQVARVVLPDHVFKILSKLFTAVLEAEP